jgi:hypothetical protein
MPDQFFCVFSADRQKKLEDIAFLRRYGSLVLAYRKQFAFWELALCAKKCIVSSRLVEVLFALSLNDDGLACLCRSC